MVAAERTASRADQESARAGRACFRVSRAEWQLGRRERRAAAPAPAVPATERGAAPASPPPSRAGGHLLRCERAFAATRLLILSWLRYRNRLGREAQLVAAARHPPALSRGRRGTEPGTARQLARRPPPSLMGSGAVVVVPEVSPRRESLSAPPGLSSARPGEGVRGPVGEEAAAGTRTALLAAPLVAVSRLWKCGPAAPLGDVSALFSALPQAGGGRSRCRPRV